MSFDNMQSLVHLIVQIPLCIIVASHSIWHTLSVVWSSHACCNYLIDGWSDIFQTCTKFDENWTQKFETSTLIKEPRKKQILRRRRSQTQARKPTISFPKSLSLASKTHKRATQRETRKTMNYYVTGLPSWMTSSRTLVDELKNRQITVLKRLPMDEKSFGCMLSHIRVVD